MSEKASGILPLSGGTIDQMDNNMIGIDDGVREFHSVLFHFKSQ